MDMHLVEWMKEADCYIAQALFVRDVLTPLVGVGLYHDDAQAIPRVISEHRSKSHRLPVYSLARADVGVRFVLRDNFYNWKMSVISERPIDSTALPHMFYASPPREPEYTGDELSPVYFEGFPPDLIFGYYAHDHRKFSAQIEDRHMLFAVIFEIMRTLGAVPIQRATTKAKHRVQLDSDRARWDAKQAARHAT